MVINPLKPLSGILLASRAHALPPGTATLSPESKQCPWAENLDSAGMPMLPGALWLQSLIAVTTE